MTLEEAVLKLEGNVSFEFITKVMKQWKDDHVRDLANMQNAENPQILAYLAGGISAMGTILDQIDECRSQKTDQA